MTLRMIFLVTAHLAIAAIVARADGPLLRTDYDNWFDGNAQQLCMGKKSEGGGMSSLADGQVTVSGADTLGIDMKFDVDCDRPENDFQNATVKSCIYSSSKYGELALKAYTSRRESAERVISMDWSGNTFDIRVYCTKKGAASAQKVEEEDPIRGTGPIQSVQELCIVNRGSDVLWGVYERSSRQVIAVTYKMKCDEKKTTQEVAACNYKAHGTDLTLKAGLGVTSKFWYQGQTDTPLQQYTLSCSKTKGAVIVKIGIQGNSLSPVNKPSQHRAQTSVGQAQEIKFTGSLFHRLDK